MLHNYDDCERREVVPFIPPGAKRILDVGCARGGFGALLTDREVYGVEPNPEAATVAAKRYRHVYRGVFPDVVPEGEVFDCIIFNDVLEHLVDPYAAVRDCRDYLAMDGHVVASIPNMRYVQVLKRLLFNADWTYTDVEVPVRMLSPAPNRDDLAVPRQCWRRRAGSWAAVIAATASAEG